MSFYNDDVTYVHNIIIRMLKKNKKKTQQNKQMCTPTHKHTNTHTKDILNISNATTECITGQWVNGESNFWNIYTNVTVNVHIW